jgi:hypothetical protein
MKLYFLSLSFFLAISSAAQASRAPNSTEAREIQTALNAIASYLPGSATARTLTAMFAQGQIRVADDWPDNQYGMTNYPVVGPQIIQLNARAIPDPSFRGYQGRYGQYALFEDRTWIASVLVHEWLHTTQSWAFVHLHRFDFQNAVEVPAWKRQRVFLERVLNRYQADTFRRVRVESLIDSVDVEIRGETD